MKFYSRPGIYLLVIALVALIGLTFVYQRNNQTSIFNSGLPSHDVLGKPLQLQKGQIVLVNYWAPWCKPCLTEMPDLNAIQAEHNDVKVIGVNFDSMSVEKISQFAKQLNINYYLLDSFPLQKLGGDNVSVLPATFIFSRQGKLVESLYGPQTKADLEQKIALLNS